MSATRKVGILGAGAVGSVVGAFLSALGHQVVVVGRAEHVDAINRKGLTVDGCRGKQLAHLEAGTDSALLRDCDVVLLAVKVQDTEAAMANARDNICPSAFVVTLQNGVRGPTIVEAALGQGRTVAAVVALGATFLKPGSVSLTADGFFVLGTPREEDAHLAAAAADLLSGAFIVETTGDVTGALWTKLVINTDLPILALTGREYPSGLLAPAVHSLSRLAAEEALGTVEGAGIAIGEGRLGEMLMNKLELLRADESLVHERVAAAPVSLLPSSVQSVLRGRSSEIEYVNGEVVRLAQGGSARAPINSALTRLSRSLEEPNFAFLDPESLRHRVTELAATAADEVTDVPLTPNGWNA